VNRKEILDRLDALAKEAGELKGSVEIAACLGVFALGAARKDKFLLKFLGAYSHLNYEDEEQDLWETLKQRGLRKKDRDIALQVKGFLMKTLRMSPRGPEFSTIRKEVMSDPPSYDTFLKLLDRGGLPVEAIKIFQIRELVEAYMKARGTA
jgi:hypothetical protein